MSVFLNQEIKYLPGVGPKRAELLEKELNIRTYGDLLYYFPFRHIDRTKFYKINELTVDLPYIQVKGVITSYQKIGQRGKSRLIANLKDETGNLELLWFRGEKWVPETYPVGKQYIAFGKPSFFNNTLNIIHPELDDINRVEEFNPRLQPLYITPEKLKNNYISSKTLQKFIYSILKQGKGKIPETLPPWLLEREKLLDIESALINVHFPSGAEKLKKSEFRLKFEELLFIQLNILSSKMARIQKSNGFIFSKVGNHFNRFYSEKLPFELTGAQKKVIKEIRKDMGSGKQMNRLLQGDVGSGKTLVALMSILISLDNGYQTAIMAPTEILATQHFRSISGMLDGLDIKIELLTGSTKKKDRDRIHASLVDGSLHILIGTHALIEDKVEFNNLGMVVIDEQHRFGVAQRARLWKKSESLPHVLVMTATPIPRTLAMTLYGDLDVSVIDELPPGRKPIQTIHITDAKRLRMHGFIRKQIDEGRQVYIVYPLISESEKMDFKDLEDGYESIIREFPSPKYFVDVLHGRMKPEAKEFSMKQFKNGKTHILVATTVIEVGVDVPNASVMVIESAERFGLSQLHQLRGRVGRGADQSFCILMTGYKLSKEARERMQTMVRTNDGFEIAEADLKLRGPGDIEGTQQSGIPFNLKIAHLGKDGQILQYARDIASSILEEDPELASEGNSILRTQLLKNKESGFNWGVVG
jgi:ATP-dependent DNA helicase RecG